MTDEKKKNWLNHIWVWIIVFMTLGGIGGVYYYFDKNDLHQQAHVDTSNLKSPFEEVNKDRPDTAPVEREATKGIVKKTYADD